MINSGSKKKIAIIGAGITGLTLAYKLSALDISKALEITIFESDPQKVGGLISTTVTPDGFTLECGPNIVVLKDDIKNLIKDLSITPIIPENFRQQVCWDNKFHDVPKTPWKLLTTSLFSISTKLKIVGGLFKKPFNLANDNQSLREFFAPFGEEVIGRLIDPAIQGVYGGDLNKLRPKKVFPQLFTAVKDGKSLLSYFLEKKRASNGAPKIATFNGGLKKIIDELKGRTKSVRVQAATVKELSRAESGSGYWLKYVGQSGHEESGVYDIVCPAVPAHLLSTMLTENTELKGAISALNAVSLSVIHIELSTDSKVPSRSFGVLWPSTNPVGPKGMEFKGVMFSSELFPHVAPPGKILATCMVGGEFSQKASDEELFKLCTDTLKKFGINCIRLIKVTRWPKAIPQYDGAHAKFLEVLGASDLEASGFYYLGADYEGVGIADRVKVAVNTAKKITGQAVI